MNLKIITLRFDPLKECFDETPLNDFCMRNSIMDCDSYFFVSVNRQYIVYSIAYEPAYKSERKRIFHNSQVKATDRLDEKELLVFERMREVRRIKAFEDGVPVYAYSSNLDMVEIIKRRCSTLESLKSVKGFGGKKIDGVGKEFVGIIRLFSEEEHKNQLDKQELKND
jgi:superfamily II DNA helicase RecQ